MPTTLDVTARWSYADNSDEYKYGSAVMTGESNVGHMTVTWDHRADEPINYHVLATDYDQYSVIWDCQNLPNGRSNEDAWVLSRYQSVSEEVKEEVRAVVGQYLDEDQMRDTYQGAACLNIEG